ncbi:MAG: T9SS type A sorting domain-containing protein [Chitinophagales bacterium]|nr:T9SS type A sorting domain-containing protein [Chitinophagales bacterium]
MRSLIKTLVSTCLFLPFFVNGQTVTIAQIQGNAASSPYLSQVVTTSGIVTAVHGTTGYFIQDSPGAWNGIYVYSPSHTASLGDDVTLTAEVDEYFDLTELKTVSAFTVNSSNNPLPAPVMLTTVDANQEMYEGVLVSVQNATCVAETNQYNEWFVDDGSGQVMVDDLIFQFSPVLNFSYNVTGPVHYSFGDYRIIPRNAGDIIINLPLYITKPPYETDITNSSLTINWSTNAVSNSIVEYGLTPALELGNIVDNNSVVDHAVNLSSLMSATVYYVRPYSVSGSDTTPSNVFKVMTSSNSSGEINVYFNHNVDINKATISEAVWTLNITDTIIKYIDKAQQTLDITMYEVQDSSILAAINKAYDRGVTVRYITDDLGNNDTLQYYLNPAISVYEGNSVGIMHDKFIIIDQADVMNSWVMTGSFNHTWANLGWDFNNLICIQDQSLAKTYTIEFEEMWGSSGSVYDANNAKFGQDKENNTPHYFNIDGRVVECYFSPSDNTENMIKERIDSAKSELEFALLIFTSNPLGGAIVDAQNRGVAVRGMIDYVESNGSEFNDLLQNGIDVKNYVNADSTQWPDGPTLHHKYAIIDFENTSETPITITGSHNWTASANGIHDENTLMIHDEEIANIYHQEFNARYNYVPDTIQTIDTTVSIDYIDKYELSIYPIPVNDVLYIQAPAIGQLEIFNADGIMVFSQIHVDGSAIIDTKNWSDGLYMVHFQSRNGDRRIYSSIVKL